MKLYVIRHAEAVEKGAMPDEARFLTPEGRSLFRRTVSKLRKKGVMPDLILTSPLVRAVQTAEILAERLGFDGDVAALPEFAGMVGKELLATLLARWPQAKEVALVGHEPHLGRLVVELLGSSGDVTLEKGAAIALKEAAAGGWSFRWYIVGKHKVTDLAGLSPSEKATAASAKNCGTCRKIVRARKEFEATGRVKARLCSDCPHAPGLDPASAV